MNEEADEIEKKDVPNHAVHLDALRLVQVVYIREKDRVWSRLEVVGARQNRIVQNRWATQRRCGDLSINVE